MKAEHRAGRGEWSYLKDWNANDDDAPERASSDDSREPPYKAIFSALIADEVQHQVAQAMAKAAPKAPAKPAAYNVTVVRGPDGLIKSLDMVPK